MKILGVVLAVMLVCGLSVATAFGEEATLLAEWLLEGEGVVGSLPAEWKGSMLTEDEGFGSVTCEGIYEMSVGTNGEFEILEMLTSAGVVVTLSSELVCKNDSGSLCESSTTDILMAPEELPWKIQWLLLSENKFSRMLRSSEAVSVSCLILGFSTTDECTYTSDENIEGVNVTGGVEFSGRTIPKGDCSVGGTGKGSIEFLSGNLVTSTEGGWELSSE